MTGEKKKEEPSPPKEEEKSENFIKRIKNVDDHFKSTFILLADESEFNKWNYMLIRQIERLQPGTFTLTESNDDSGDRILNPWTLKRQLLSFDDLQRYSMNSQFILNPADNDKISLHQRITIESNDFNELFEKYGAK